VKKLFKVTVKKSITVVASDVDAAKEEAARKLNVDVTDDTIETEFISDIDVASIRSKKS